MFRCVSSGTSDYLWTQLLVSSKRPSFSAVVLLFSPSLTFSFSLSGVVSLSLCAAANASRNRCSRVLSVPCAKPIFARKLSSATLATMHVSDNDSFTCSSLIRVVVKGLPSLHVKPGMECSVIFGCFRKSFDLGLGIPKSRLLGFRT